MADALLNKAISCSHKHVEVQMKVLDGINVAMETAMDLASELRQYDENIVGKNKDTADELQSLMLEYLKMEQEMNSFNDAVAKTKQEITQLDGNVEDFPKIHDILTDKLNDIGQGDSIQTLQTHERYKDLLNTLHTSRAAENDACDVDDDIAMTQEVINTKCPITHQIMTDPVKNRHCGHTYDRTGILQLIKNRKHKAMCPMGGCANKQPVREGDLEDNREIRRYIERQQRTLRQTQQ